MTAIAGAAAVMTFVAACSNDVNQGFSGTPSSLVAAAGDGLNETVGLPIGPFVVKVTDTSGTGVPNITVNFTSSAGLTLVNATATTNADGSAFTSGTFGHTAGSYTITATVAGISAPLVFHVTANADVASVFFAVGGNNQTAPGGTTVGELLVAGVTDQYGNPINGASVTWSAATGTLSNVSAHTGANGRAQATYTLPPGVGTRVVTATSTINGATVTVTFTETGT